MLRRITGRWKRTPRPSDFDPSHLKHPGLWDRREPDGSISYSLNYSIVVIEIKRPMRNDVSEDKNPIQQSLDYVMRLRSGGLLTASGRPIPPSQNSPAFCYILADLTSTMINHCIFADLKPTHDGLGYFGFNDGLKAYIEVVSFDRLVNAATERNKAFFDKLGLPAA